MSMPVLMAFCSVVITAPAYSQTPWETLVAGPMNESGKLAVEDLRRYLWQVSGTLPVVQGEEAWRANPVPAVLLGTAPGWALVEGQEGDVDATGEEGYTLRRAEVAGQPVVLVLAHAPRGVVNGAYGLLRELGYGFYLGSEAAPDVLPDTLPVASVTRQPALRVRGVLPWYNFFNSPTTWDPVDHRAFVDQLVRMGANFVGFHVYDHEPFVGYEEEGQSKWGTRLAHTGVPTWGTVPTATGDFPFGIDRLFAQEHFGAATTAIGDNLAAVRAEKDVLADALDYARRRGLHACLGFEANGDPTKPEFRDAFVKRLEHTLARYPSLDMVWIWQTETQGAQGFPVENLSPHHLPYLLDPTSPLVNYGIERRTIFDRVVNRTEGASPFFQDNPAGQQARAIEGARLELFSKLALSVLGRLERRPRLSVSGWVDEDRLPRLLVSGWGGEDRLLSAEYYDGLDKVLPPEVTFTSLDFISMRGDVDQAYHALPAGRERWPILWLEADGDQWHPQPQVHVAEEAMGNILAGGSQGVLGIHWRTRDIEENFSYMVERAWNPDLTAEGFFEELARRCYDPAVAAEMAKIHIELDLMGYRWAGGNGQAECAPFSWGFGEPEKIGQLRNLHDRVGRLAAKAGRGQDRMQWILRRIEWVIASYEVQERGRVAGQRLVEARSAEGDDARALAAEALGLMDDRLMADALRAYARRVSTRGEYGVLATICSKMVVMWQQQQQEARGILGQTELPETPTNWLPDPEVIVPRFHGSVPEGQPLVIEALALGGKDAWLHYKTAARPEWTTLPMPFTAGWVASATVPASRVLGPAVTFVVSFSASPAKPFASGPHTVTVLPEGTAHVRKASTGWPQPGELGVWIEPGRAHPAIVRWNTIAGASHYRVYRDGVKLPLIETPATDFPDTWRGESLTYKVEAVSPEGMLICSESVIAPVPAMAPPAHKPEVTATAGGSGILLRWDGPAEITHTAYRITRRLAGGGDPELLAEQLPYTGGENRYRDAPPEGTWVYTVCAVDVLGQVGPAGEATAEYALRADLEPVFRLTSPLPVGAVLTGKVALDGDALDFSGGNVSIPDQPVFQFEGPRTIRFRFLTRSVAGMPVLAGNGVFQADGWYVQIHNGRLTLVVGKTMIAGPAVVPNQWHDVQVEFDGREAALCVDGEVQVGAQAVVTPITSNRPLVLGTYTNDSEEFRFHGTISGFTVYDDVVPMPQKE